MNLLSMTTIMLLIQVDLNIQKTFLKKNKKGFYGVPITILNSYLLYLSNIRPMYLIRPKKKGKLVYTRLLIEVK